MALEEAWLTSGDFARLRSAFHAAHRATYGHSNENAEIWLKELRAHITGRTPKPRILPLRSEAAGISEGTRTVRLFGREVSATTTSCPRPTPCASWGSSRSWRM